MERDEDTDTAVVACDWTRALRDLPSKASNLVVDLDAREEKEPEGVCARGGDGSRDLVRVLIDVDRDLQHVQVHAACEEDSVDDGAGGSEVHSSSNVPRAANTEKLYKAHNQAKDLPWC